MKLLGGGKAGGGFNAVMIDEDGAQTLLSQIIEQLSSVQEGEPDKYQRTRAALKKFLSSLKVTTLDTDLMLTLLQWDDNKALAKFLAKHGSKLAALEPVQQKTMRRMLERMKDCPKERDMNDILYDGDVSALAGDREKAKALWGQVMTLSPAGIVPREDAMERLTWARPKGNIETWGPEKAGQAFANHMREFFLGADAAERQALIRTYCTGPDKTNEIRMVFDRYAVWLRNNLAYDKNLELIPLILDGELADYKFWLRDTFLLFNDFHFNDFHFFSDPARTIKTMQMLGFLGDTKTFKPRLFGEDGSHTAMAVMMASLRGRYDLHLTAIEDIRKRLQELQPRTFGADLVLALLDKDSAAGASTFLKAHQADIAQLPEASRKPVLDMLRKAWPEMPELSAGSSP